MDLTLNNLQWLICHKTQQTEPNKIDKTNKNISFVLLITSIF